MKFAPIIRTLCSYHPQLARHFTSRGRQPNLSSVVEIFTVKRESDPLYPWASTVATTSGGSEGFYATNNQFQIAGPKGFIQVKVLENDDLYVRDFLGVPDDAVRQKIVFFSGETLKDGNVKEGVREYSETAGLGCDCCEITGVDAKTKDGILRMIVSRVKGQGPREEVYSRCASFHKFHLP